MGSRALRLGANTVQLGADTLRGASPTELGARARQVGTDVLQLGVSTLELGLNLGGPVARGLSASVANQVGFGRANALERRGTFEEVFGSKLHGIEGATFEIELPLAEGVICVPQRRSTEPNRLQVRPNTSLHPRLVLEQVGGRLVVQAAEANICPPFAIESPAQTSMGRVTLAKGADQILEAELVRLRLGAKGRLEIEKRVGAFGLDLGLDRLLDGPRKNRRRDPGASRGEGARARAAFLSGIFERASATSPGSVSVSVSVDPTQLRLPGLALAGPSTTLAVKGGLALRTLEGDDRVVELRDVTGTLGRPEASLSLSLSLRTLLDKSLAPRGVTGGRFTIAGGGLTIVGDTLSSMPGARGGSIAIELPPGLDALFEQASIRLDRPEPREGETSRPARLSDVLLGIVERVSLTATLDLSAGEHPIVLKGMPPVMLNVARLTQGELTALVGRQGSNGLRIEQLDLQFSRPVSARYDGRWLEGSSGVAGLIGGVVTFVGNRLVDTTLRGLSIDPETGDLSTNSAVRLLSMFPIPLLGLDTVARYAGMRPMKVPVELDSIQEALSAPPRPRRERPERERSTENRTTAVGPWLRGLVVSGELFAALETSGGDVAVGPASMKSAPARFELRGSGAVEHREDHFTLALRPELSIRHRNKQAEETTVSATIAVPVDGRKDGLSFEHTKIRAGALSAEIDALGVGTRDVRGKAVLRAEGPLAAVASEVRIETKQA